ncbi:hypothetical protein AgCh_025673 [Apium graveolens]
MLDPTRTLAGAAVVVVGILVVMTISRWVVVHTRRLRAVRIEYSFEGGERRKKKGKERLGKLPNVRAHEMGKNGFA